MGRSSSLCRRRRSKRVLRFNQYTYLYSMAPGSPKAVRDFDAGGKGIRAPIQDRWPSSAVAERCLPSPPDSAPPATYGKWRHLLEDPFFRNCDSVGNNYNSVPGVRTCPRVLQRPEQHGSSRIPGGKRSCRRRFDSCTRMQTSGLASPYSRLQPWPSFNGGSFRTF